MCGCSGWRRAPPGMQPKPKTVFPGEKGFRLLECLDIRYRNRGKSTGLHYDFTEDQQQYVDVRDLSGITKDSFRKVDDADTPAAGEGKGETPQLGGDSEGN